MVLVRVEVEAIRRLWGFLLLLEEPEVETVLEIAYNLGITYYGASYVATAVDKGLILVTDDRDLSERILENQDFLKSRFKRELKVASSAELEHFK